jgi:N-acylneuraminate cytidylyltransferase
MTDPRFGDSAIFDSPATPRPRVLAIIPARWGSKGIAKKNLAECGGRPLVDWVIEAANESRHVTRGVLSSDGLQIRERATMAGGKVWPLPRPEELARDETPTEPVIQHAIDQVGEEFDAYVLLQPTSPLTRGQDIDRAVEMLLLHPLDSVVSVVPSHTFLWRRLPESRWGLRSMPINYSLGSRPRRQDMVNEFEENGAIYVFTRALWEETGCRLGGRVGLYEMGEEHRFQVDSEMDLAIVDRWLWSRQGVDRGGRAALTDVRASGVEVGAR